MQQEIVSNVCEFCIGFVIVFDDRGAGKVAAGHYQGFEVMVVKQKIVHGGVWQHHPYKTVIRRDIFSQGEGGILLQQNNRLCPATQIIMLVRGKGGKCFYPVQVGSHDSQGFVRPAFSLSEPGNCLMVKGIDCKMKPADSFYSNDFPSL